jgi:hypothetical protein
MSCMWPMSPMEPWSGGLWAAEGRPMPAWWWWPMWPAAAAAAPAWAIIMWWGWPGMSMA